MEGDIGIAPITLSTFQDLQFLTGAFILIISQSAHYLGCNLIQQVKFAIADTLLLS